MKNRGVSWADVQSLTLGQAEFIATAGVIDEETASDEAVDRQIEFIGKVAAADGLTLRQFGQLGADAMAERVAAFSGTPITAGHIRPLLSEPEFTSP